MSTDPTRLGKLGRYQIEYVDPETLVSHPENARSRESIDDIVDSIRANEFFAPIIANRNTREIIDGNHSWHAAKRLRMPEIPVVFHDIEVQHARRILAAANKTADNGTYDPDAMEALLGKFDGNYYGTGFTESDVAALMEGADDYDDFKPKKKELYTRRVTDCPECGHTFIPNTYKKDDLMPDGEL